MSKKIEMAVQAGPREDTRGLKEIPETLRRHARLSPKQMRISMTIATVVILVLAALMIVSQSRATDILKNNESAVLLNEAMHAERIELTNKLALTDRYGTDTINGKRLFVLQEIGQQNGDEANKLYWLIYCNEDEAKEYEKTLKNYKQLILLDQKEEKGLYVAVARASELDESIAKLASKGR